MEKKFKNKQGRESYVCLGYSFTYSTGKAIYESKHEGCVSVSRENIMQTDRAAQGASRATRLETSLQKRLGVNGRGCRSRL